MDTAAAQREWLNELDHRMRREIAAQRVSMEELWARPLADRCREGRSLGPLDLMEANNERIRLMSKTPAAEWADCSLREGDFVRLSRDTPAAPHEHCLFLGEDHAGIHLARVERAAKPVPGPGWTIDPDFVDLTSRFAATIEALAGTSLGRERILPLLMGSTNPRLDVEVFEATRESLSDADQTSWHDSQQDAIAACVAARDASLVQGPPGTGKTRVLGEVARRLVEQGERILITGPTHRAIHQALKAARAAISEPIQVAKIGPAPLGGEGVECHDSYTGCGLFDCGEPHVAGATPHALWSRKHGLRAARFDTVLIDEASQVTPLLAAMAMLRGERWLFFGDDCQLPPVVVEPGDEPPRRRSVFGLLKHRGFDCMLTETWRLNRALAAWPSATFYGNRLVVRHDRHLELSPASREPELRSEPALFLRDIVTRDCTVLGDDEATHAVHLVRELVRGGIDPREIGVITPFRAQAGRIRRLLAIDPPAPGLQRAVTVDTVERFQGQEREVIVVSLTASRESFIAARADFLFQPERLNVAVTRARRKTVLIASRALLAQAEALATAGHEGATCFSSLVLHARAAVSAGSTL